MRLIKGSRIKSFINFTLLLVALLQMTGMSYGYTANNTGTATLHHREVEVTPGNSGEQPSSPADASGPGKSLADEIKLAKIGKGYAWHMVTGLLCLFFFITAILVYRKVIVDQPGGKPKIVLTVGAKILGSSVLSLAVLAVLSFVLIDKTVKIGSEIEQITRIELEAMKILNRTQSRQWERQVLLERVFRYCENQDTPGNKLYLQAVAKLRHLALNIDREIESSIQYLLKIPGPSGSAVNEIRDLILLLETLALKNRQLNNVTEEVVALMNARKWTESHPREDKIIAKADHLGREPKRRLDHTRSRIHDSLLQLKEEKFYVSGFMIAAALVALIGLLLSSSLATSIQQDIYRLSRQVKKIAEGDLEQTFAWTGQDEIGMLARAIKNMIDSFKTIANEVRDSVKDSAAGTQEITAAVIQLSKELANQAAAVNNILFLMKQIMHGLRQHAGLAGQAEEMAGKASLGAKAIGKVVTTARATMKQIAEKTLNIREIAQQTNFLALKTSLEAVNGVEQSKNFAAAALRIGKLAIRSKSAAGEITQQVNSNLIIVENADENLKILLPDLNKTLDLVREITAADNMQEALIAQADKAIQLLESVIRKNSAAVEEMTFTADDILSHLGKIKDMIDGLLIETGDSKNTE